MNHLVALSLLCLCLTGFTFVNAAQNESYNTLRITIERDSGGRSLTCSGGPERRAYNATTDATGKTTFTDLETGESIPGSTEQLLEKYNNDIQLPTTRKPVKCPELTSFKPKTTTFWYEHVPYDLTPWGEWEECEFSTAEDGNVRRRMAQLIETNECESDCRGPKGLTAKTDQELNEEALQCLLVPDQAKVGMKLRNFAISSYQPNPNFLMTPEWSEWSGKGVQWRYKIVLQQTECRSKDTPHCKHGCPDINDSCEVSECDRPPSYCLEKSHNPCPLVPTKDYQGELYCNVHDMKWKCQDPTEAPFMLKRIGYKAADNKERHEIYRDLGWA